MPYGKADCVCVSVCVCILAVTAQLFTNATKTNMYSFDRLLAMSIWIIICGFAKLKLLSALVLLTWRPLEVSLVSCSLDFCVTIILYY